MRKALRAGLLGMILASVTAVTPPARAEIRVGVVNSLTGPVSAIGVPYAKGYAAAALGTPEVAGQKIVVIAMDDRSDPTVAAQVGRKLIEEERVDVLVGSAAAPASYALYAVAAEAKVPLVYAANGAVEGERGAWEITIPQPPALMIQAVSEYMAAHQLGTVAFIGFNDAWGDSVFQGLRASADPAGIKIIDDERYARTDTSVTPQVLKMIARRPAAIMTGGAGAPAALPHLALAERGWKGPVFSSHAIVNNDIVRIAGKSLEGVIAPTGPVVVADQLADDNPLKAAAATYRKLYQQANHDSQLDPFAAYAYDSMLVLHDALARVLKAGEKPGTPEFRAALREALSTTRDVVGTEAIYNFTPGQRTGVDSRSRVLVTLKNGAWVLVK